MSEGTGIVATEDCARLATELGLPDKAARHQRFRDTDQFYNVDVARIVADARALGLPSVTADVEYLAGALLASRMNARNLARTLRRQESRAS